MENELYDLTNEPRYKELLDDTVQRTTGHYSYKHLCDLMEKDKSFMGAWYAVREDAQNRFFNELLKQKEKESNIFEDTFEKQIELTIEYVDKLDELIENINFIKYNKLKTR